MGITFERIWIDNKTDVPNLICRCYPLYILDLPLRRQAQYLLRRFLFQKTIALLMTLQDNPLVSLKVKLSYPEK